MDASPDSVLLTIRSPNTYPAAARRVLLVVMHGETLWGFFRSKADPQLDIPEKVGIGLARGSEKVAKRILELLADGPMRPSALREAVGIRSRVHFSRCYMTPLVEKGLVARTDPDKPMSPRQEYKLA